MTDERQPSQVPTLTTDDLVHHGLIELERRPDGIYATLTKNGRRYGLRLEAGSSDAGDPLVVRVTGEASIAEGFDEHQTALYLKEVIAQARLAHFAFSLLRAAAHSAFADFKYRMSETFHREVPAHVLAKLSTRPGVWRVERTDELFVHAEAVLAHAATVSHILAPGYVKGDKEQQAWARERGRILRRILGRPPEALRRNVCDAVVHVDERLDKQAMRPPEVGLADRHVILESHEWSLQKFGWRRVLILDTLTYVFDEVRLDLRTVVDVLADVADCAHWQLADYMGTPLEGLVSIRGKPVWFGSPALEEEDT